MNVNLASASQNVSVAVVVNVEMKIKIKNKNDENLVGIFHKADSKKELAIVCHGFPGSKDEESIKKICERFQESGINSFRFDFSGFGESEGKTISTTKRLSDLESVVSYFHNEGFEVGLIGYSRGATISILFASKNKTIRFIIPIAGESDTRNFLKKIFPEQREKILKGEMFYYIDKRGRQYPVTSETIKDLESYNPLDAVKKIKCPVLFIHGEKDNSVSPEASESLYKNANSQKDIMLYKNADHSFSNTEDLEDMIKYCIKWIKKL